MRGDVSLSVNELLIEGLFKRASPAGTLFFTRVGDQKPKAEKKKDSLEQA